MMMIITIIINIIVKIIAIIVVTIEGAYYKMETFFINTKNSRTTEPHRFKLDLTDKLNLKDPKKNFALANLSIYYTWKILNQNTTIINLKCLLQLGMKLFIYLMVLILSLIFKITLNLSSRNTKL